MKTPISHLILAVLATLSLPLAAQTTFTFSTAQRGPLIGKLHYGIFYEEINHAGDGGIYGELVRNGSMEENGSNPDYWWTLGNATYSISTQNLINGAQNRAMRLNLTRSGDGTRNIGYWGINIVKGETYRASFWIRTANNWTGNITLTLENYEGADLGHTVVHVENAEEWTKYTAEIKATGAYQQGWFALRGSKAGTIYLDCISLFPPTYKNRPNGMRRDLAEKLAALHPRFMRFPGGCYIEGGNRFQWRHTVGPVEERLGLYNSHWGYPVSNGMGFHEFLQLAEDLGAEPLFVVNVGLGHGWYENYQHIEGYIQEALDALEYSNGDTTTFWGRKRAENGHPEPFRLRLLEIGNENYNFSMNNNSDQSDHYPQRFRQFYDAIKAKYPDVVCIGNVESWGTDDPTWRNGNPVEVVDEHYYRSPDWFAANYHKYDNFSRTSHKIYNGEYAVTSDFGTNGTLKAALGEAIYMAGMERNSDVCVMASYAPIFMNENEAQWRPDMLHYNAYSSFGTPSYWAQQMMASTVGHQNITWTETGNQVGLEGARLGLGSWGTSVTYSNISVTSNTGEVLFSHEGEITSPASTYGTYQTFDVVTDNCTIELDAVKNSGSEGFLLTFAYADGNNYAWWNLGGWNNGQHGVEQAVNGTKTTLATTSGSIDTGTTYHLKVVRQGLTARCYINDRLTHTVTLSASQGQRLFACASLNETEDTAIVKVINYAGTAVETHFAFSDATIGDVAQLRVMSNKSNTAENTMSNPMYVSPKELALTSSDGVLNYEVPAYSLIVIQIPLAEVSKEVKIQPASAIPYPVIRYDFEDGKPTDDKGALNGSLQGGAKILELDDGNHALYTGETSKNGYANLGNAAARAIGQIVNGEAYSVSTDLMLQDAGHLDAFCWAWTICNGTSSYVGLINKANNLNWYFEKVSSGTMHVSSHSGLKLQRWHNIAITSSSTEVRIYVDGELRATGTPNRQALLLVNGTSAWLGRSPFAADSYLTDAWIDDLSFYDTTLTPKEVLALSERATRKSTQCTALASVPDEKENEKAVTLIGNATEVDITTLLTNPDFVNGSTGWEGTLFSAAPGTVAEHFSQLFDTYQMLHNMPAGTYRLEWQGFYRNGNIANAYLRYTSGTEDLAEVYAATDADFDGDGHDFQDVASVGIMSLYDASVPYTYSPYTYPDNVSTAHTAFIGGRYGQLMLFCLSETADLRLGLRKMTPCVYDWACVDNFRLTYVNRNTTLSGIGMPTAQSDASASDHAAYDLTGRRLGTRHPGKGIYVRQGQKFVVK